MKYAKQLLAIIAMFILLVSCTHDDGQYELIASEKSLPADFYEIAFVRKEVPFFYYGVTKAENQSQYEKSWDFYRLEKKRPSENFNEKNVFFIGLEESGSCPIELVDITVNSKNEAMTIELNDSGGACTADATPRTSVIEIDKDISKDLKNAIMVEEDLETTIPIDYYNALKND
ncbi:hypothetical protein [Rossellomorea vietnamensis]|uniref:hypothetical protein n=1 Tax=Rossellomorea vietnamensis TaxID=218284 RepID=UPI00077C85DE|nr:hypothetical protein [Rossellomorea vietnamensis]